MSAPDRVRGNRISGSADADDPAFGGNWRLRGACAVADPDLFFPERGQSSRAAKRVCTGCEVVQECLVWALEARVEHGVWGALNWSERRKLISDAYQAEPNTAPPASEPPQQSTRPGSTGASRRPPNRPRPRSGSGRPRDRPPRRSATNADA